MGCGVVERHLEKAQPTKKTFIDNWDVSLALTLATSCYGHKTQCWTQSYIEKLVCKITLSWPGELFDWLKNYEQLIRGLKTT